MMAVASRDRCRALTTTPFLLILQCDQKFDHTPVCQHHSHLWTEEGRYDFHWHDPHDDPH